MPKKAIVILADGFEEIEASRVIDILRRADIDVTIAGLSEAKAKGSHEIEILADKKLDDAGEDFDACILPGGMPGATNLASSQKVNDIIKDFHKKGKLIAAICAAPSVVLAPTGILDGKTTTGYPGMQKGFSKDTSYRQDKVVKDGNIITSQGPATALDFALAIVKSLAGEETADKVAKAVLL